MSSQSSQWAIPLSPMTDTPTCSYEVTLVFPRRGSWISLLNELCSSELPMPKSVRTKTKWDRGMWYPQVLSLIDLSPLHHSDPITGSLNGDSGDALVHPSFRPI